MSNLHPIMAAALNPFAPKRLVPTPLPTVGTTYPSPPASGRSQFTYEWNTDCAATIVCHLDYNKGEPQTYDDPGDPEFMELCAAYVYDIDILPLLSPKQIEQIEIDALEHMHRSINDD